MLGEVAIARVFLPHVFGLSRFHAATSTAMESVALK
jgi:hypothetical protein